MFQPICKTTDVPSNTARVFVLEGVRIAVYNCEGRYFASQDECSHAKVPLDQGYIDTKTCTIECPEHGSKFDLATGAVRNLPATQPITIYPVTIEGDDVLIEMH